MNLQNRLNNESVTLEELQDAFFRFSEASQRLEDRYQALLEETDVLRAQLKKKDEEMCRALRLATLGETAAGLAHEVRNPLGAIKIFVSLLKQDLASNEESSTIIYEIEKCITTLDNVIANMLQFSKGAPQEFAPVNLNAIIREISYQCTAPNHITTHTSFCLESNPFIQGNETALRQVFFNLVNNAIQAMNNEGSLFISTTDDDDHVQIKLADCGPGINESLKETLFDPFVTSRTEGTGLGLAVVKRIIDQHGGTITCNNDGGAVFTCRLPRIQKTRVFNPEKGQI